MIPWVPRGQSKINCHPSAHLLAASFLPINYTLDFFNLEKKKKEKKKAMDSLPET
jgi:hypothetical protein